MRALSFNVPTYVRTRVEPLVARVLTFIVSTVIQARGPRLHWGPRLHRGPGHFLASLAAGVRVSFSLFLSLYSSRLNSLRRSFRNARPLSPFSLIYNAQGTWRRFPHLSKFLLTRTYVRRIGIGSSIGSILFLVTMCLAHRLALRLRFCIA